MREEALKACAQQEVKQVRIIGAQNEVCDMALKANAELEQINARLGSVSVHYDLLAKRSEELKDEGEIQVQICTHLEQLCAAEAYDAAIRYANAVDGDGRYRFISMVNQSGYYDGSVYDMDDEYMVDELLKVIEEFEKEEEIPF
jgi:trans-aconitate methyltransferase